MQYQLSCLFSTYASRWFVNAESDGDALYKLTKKIDLIDDIHYVSPKRWSNGYVCYTRKKNDHVQNPVLVEWNTEISDGFKRAENARLHWITEWLKRWQDTKPTNRSRIGRNIIDSIWRHGGEPKHKVCRWCFQSISENENGRWWHKPCSQMYEVCAGRIPYPFQKMGWCAECGKTNLYESKTEVDHVIPLSLATATMDIEVLVKAFSFRNLRPICKPCHGVKSGKDRKNLTDWYKLQELKYKIEKSILTETMTPEPLSAEVFVASRGYWLDENG